MIKAIKDMPIPQGTLYGGFAYSLANLLNNKSILIEVSALKNVNITDYHRNKVYHKYTNQRSQQLDFIQRKLYIPMFPFSIRGEREKNLFEFGEYSLNQKGKYKVYFIDANLTKLRKHEFIVLKPMDKADEIIVIDPMQNEVLRMDKDSFFLNYYVMGYSTLENKRYKEVLLDEKDLAHLLNDSEKEI